MPTEKGMLSMYNEIHFTCFILKASKLPDNNTTLLFNKILLMIIYLGENISVFLKDTGHLTDTNVCMTIM